MGESRTGLTGLLLLVGIAWSPTLSYAEPVSLTTGDGVTLAATRSGSGADGIVLVHGREESSSDWHGLAARLDSQGFHVLSVDLRGHGQSGGTLGQDLSGLTADVRSAVSWLDSHGATTVSVIGADLGANLALNAAIDNDTIDNLLLLSPAMNISGVTVGSAIGSYGKRPLLLVAGKGDAITSRTATLLSSKATGAHHLELTVGSERGTKLLSSVPGLEVLLISWIRGSFRNSSDAASMRPTIGAESEGAIETTGTRLEDRR